MMITSRRAFVTFLMVGTFVGSTLANDSSSTKVTFKTQDNLQLTGQFIQPQKSKPTVILLHGLGSSKSEWKPLIKTLSKKGWGVFAFDARGHGESSLTRSKDGNASGYFSLGPAGPGSQWERMIDDVGSAIRFLTKKKRVKRNSIIVGGASLGANVALNYASLTRSIKGVFLLSPGLKYRGIETEPALGRLKKTPVLIVVSPKDRYSYKSSEQLKKKSDLVELWTDVNQGHGVQMFDDPLLTRLMLWLGTLN